MALCVMPIHEDLVSGNPDRPGYEGSFFVISVIVLDNGNGYLLQDIVGVLEVRDHRGDERRDGWVGPRPMDRDFFGFLLV